uniref:Sulfatase N-terminal domain-containing protein n=1 Tax=Panagrolaimus davidi TaxID=227884 RepID=A0A914P6C6_9BILA
MPKTFYTLQEYYEAVTFKHLNKIGINSHPNAFAFLLGKMYGVIPRSPFSRGHVGDYKSRDEACKTPLDKEQFIGFRYKDDGYVTMMAEDWALGAFLWPNCSGFKKTPMDHYMKPFHLRFDYGKYKSPDLHKIIHKDSCRDYHYDIFEYLGKFLKAYPDKPKFSISWISYLTHDEQNALSSADDYFYHFFNNTKKDFENSYVFFMGDHGLRFGKMRETRTGEIEDNNPFLFLSVPKPLRAALIPQLRKNSKELITHFDIYATLNEIPQPSNPRISKPLLHGNSLFRPLPKPRTCDSLKIPFEYCICRAEKTLLPKNNKIGIPAAKLMIEQINYELYNSNYTRDLCFELTLNESAEIILEDFGGEQILRVYKITFSTHPGDGKFWGIVSYDPKSKEFNIISTKFSRLDSYGSKSKCASTSNLASYCFCMDQSISSPKLS